MTELKPTKGKSITIPTMVKRYCVAIYVDGSGWENTLPFFTTPESALEYFFNLYKNSDPIYKPKFYKVFELELEIPIIEPDK